MVSLVNFRTFSELAETDLQMSSPNATADTNTHPSINRSQQYFQEPPTLVDGKHQPHHYHYQPQPQPQQQLSLSAKPTDLPKEHFEIRWTNLNYQVEPKWYQRLKSGTFSTCDGGGGASSSLSAPSSSGSSADSTSSSDLGYGGGGTALDSKSQSGKMAGGGSSKARTANILNGLNGSVKSGQVTAILGPSGAGKTSLLSCLTGKNKSGVSGAVEVISTNGGLGRLEPLSVCQIPQKDYLLNQLTVRENLWFASRLKHPEEPFDHDINIERVVELLKLETCIDTKISKISGGQYKRVSIAQELLSNPDILILDEPTSGLDSLTCYKTVMVLRDLARLSPNPMAIIVTIHQPQREVFDLFNHVYILAVGGRCIYEGHPSNSIKTINECGTGLSFDSHMYNPASYLVEIASSEFGEKPIEVLVNHQRQEFRQRTQAQDQRNLLITGGMLEQPNQTPKRPRHSPMIARFKTTLSSLKGNRGSASPRTLRQQQIRQQQMQQLQPTAYANEAFVSNLTLNEVDQHHGTERPDQQVSEHFVIPTTTTTTMLQDDAYDETVPDGEFYLDARLQTHKHNHQGHFLRHCQLLTKRSWLCLCKDPMLTTLRFSAHIIVPLLITIVYGSRVGKPNACPLYESDMDLIDYARRGAKRLLNLQDELRNTFENVGLYFLSIYAFTFSTMCLTSLSFPLNMHVLLKEVRNGWYSIPTYFIGKSLADFPLEFILPTLTLMITYPLTGQPSSYMEWRFLLATSVFVVTSLIAQTQGLIFGALFMNAMQAAVFVAPVSTTPLILLSGFLIRISQMPLYLQKLSSLSYFRYAIESLTIIRYGFGQCECDPKVVNGKPVSATGVPDQLRTMTNYWLSTFDTSANDADSSSYSLADNLNGTITDLVATSTSSPLVENATTVTEQPVDFFQDLTVLLARANSFGADIKTCEDLKPYPMIDFSLEDSQLYTWLVALMVTLVISKIANYLVVKYSVKWRL